MRKFGYVLLFGVFLTGIAMLFPHSPIYPIAVHYVQKKLEARWNCSAVEKRIFANPLAGNLSLEDLRIETAEGVNPAWRLQIKHATVSVRYLPLFREKAINRLTLDGVDFKQEYTEAAGRSTQKEPAGQAERRKSPPRPSPGDRSATLEGLHINHLVIRDGSFEYIRIDASGGRQRINADHISVVRRNVFLDKRPDAFFHSLFHVSQNF